MSWRILFGTTVQHSFFSTTSGPMLDFVPVLETQAVMRSADMIHRADNNRVIFCYDDAKEEILRCCIPKNTGRLDFIFHVYTTDPRYELYTESGLSFGTIPCYSSLEKPVAREHGLQLERINENAAQQMTERAATGGNGKYPVKRPVFILNISLIEQDFQEQKEYLICCAARKTYWKYYLLGELAEQESEIIDLRGDIQFRRSSGRQTPFPNKEAAVFYSSEAIPLEERSNRQFQLRRQGSNGNKVLIKRLPNASVENLSKENIKGKEVDVSEIYINY
ncbi:MAG: hypothetical protein QTN59_13755 [Candidatus Electrothrix communis]|nr:hypothetical protein [Desulfobulbus sp. US4]WLE95738.1 MAG: hypothetical protein QTN59_13755 [Candidatus Electrothrix communis]